MRVGVLCWNGRELWFSTALERRGRERRTAMDTEEGTVNPRNGRRTKSEEEEEEAGKPKLVVIMGATGSGKSRLAIDLASHFPIEIINADSMQVYQGLDIITNKVPLHEQKGVPHHLLGTISPDIEFTSKNFRDSAIPLINDILSRNCLPVIVGGTNYYIQALVSPFLLDDSAEDLEENCINDDLGNDKVELGRDNIHFSYECLKDLDPVAANRIHPNDHRKVAQYLSLYARSGVVPSKLFLGKAMENWGRVDNFRYDCCFICVDASLPVLDQYVEHRVDCMVDAGLLDEVFEINNPNADYTRGLQQAIGVREFDEFLKVFKSEGAKDLTDGSCFCKSINKGKKEDMKAILNSSDGELKSQLKEAIDKVKANTRRLVRRQKRRLSRLQTLFGWKIHFVDATEPLLCNSDDSWEVNVVEPSREIIRSFLDVSSLSNLEAGNCIAAPKVVQRDLWTQYICKACGNRVLRGAHEWEQHKQGRGHRKRICRLRKSQGLCIVE